MTDDPTWSEWKGMAPEAKLKIVEARIARIDSVLADTCEEAILEIERLRAALKNYEAGSHDGLWGRIRAYVVHGAPNYEEGIKIARQITEWQCAADRALQPNR